MARGGLVSRWDLTLNPKPYRTLIRALVEPNVKSSWTPWNKLAAGPWVRAPPGGGAALKLLGDDAPGAPYRAALALCPAAFEQVN